jgi:predicted anti-sigma-YlaC factor YlaD
MMTCKQVSTFVSTGQLADAPLATRFAVSLHLAMCRHCRAFRRQLGAIARAARTLNRVCAAEPRTEFEARIVQRLRLG